MNFFQKRHIIIVTVLGLKIKLPPGRILFVPVGRDEEMKERSIRRAHAKELIRQFHNGPPFVLGVFGRGEATEMRILKEFDALYEACEGLGVEKRGSLPR